MVVQENQKYKLNYNKVISSFLIFGLVLFVIEKALKKLIKPRVFNLN